MELPEQFVPARRDSLRRADRVSQFPSRAGLVRESCHVLITDINEQPRATQLFVLNDALTVVCAVTRVRFNPVN